MLYTRYGKDNPAPQEAHDFYVEHWVKHHDNDVIMGLSDPYAVSSGFTSRDMIIAEKNGKVVGLATFTQDEISLVLVAPNERKSGIGFALGKEVLKTLGKTIEQVRYTIESREGGLLIEALKRG